MADKTSPKPRNPLAGNPLLRKSHVHDKDRKPQRSKDKAALKKQLRERAGQND